MNPQPRYIKIGVSVAAWSIVISAATYQSHTPVVFGRYSWGYIIWLGLLIGVALTLSLVDSTRYQTLYRLRTALLMSVISLFLTLGVVELGIRLVDPLGISYYERIGTYSRDKLPDNQLVFRHKPSWETRYGNVLVTYNERGLRDRPILPKVPNEYRVLALGDSVTFGWGVDQDKTFAARLESLLPSRLHRPVRVINSGVGGYNTVQEVTYFKQDGIALQPDLVLLTYVQNDIDELNPAWNPWAAHSSGEKSIGERFNRMVGQLWLYRLVHHTYNYGLPKVKAEPATTSLQEGTGWRQSMAALRELVALCEQHHIPLMVFFERVNPNDNSVLLHDVLLNAHGVPVQDMAAWFMGLDESVIENSKVDRHHNAEGHRVMAEHMANDIVAYWAMRSSTTTMARHK
ncbi:MAG: GDSL-type esterase/lipase family protein [Nitrospira sp.]